MAFGNLGNAGTAVGSTSTSLFTLTTTSNSFNAASGRFGILRVAIDNISTVDGPSNDIVSVTGGNGTWTKLGEYTNAQGGGSNGITVALWLFMPNANNAVGTVFTINLSGNTVDKSARFWIHTNTVGQSVRDASTPVYNSVNAANNFGSCAISGLTSKEYLFVSALGKEANTTTTITPSASFTAVATLRSRNNASAVVSAGEYRIATSTGDTSNPTLAVSGDAVNVFVALEEYTPGGSTQNLTPSLFTRTKTVFAPSVSVGAVSLTPPLVSRAKSIFAPSVVAGAVTITPPLVSRTKVIYAPTVAAGTVIVTPPLATRIKNLFAPDVETGPVALTPPLVTLAKQVFPPTVVEEGGEQTITPPLVARAKSIFAPTVVRAVRPAPSLGGGGSMAGRPPWYDHDKKRREDIAKALDSLEPKPAEKLKKAKAKKPQKVVSAVPESIADLSGMEMRLAEIEMRQRQAIIEQEDEEAVMLLLAA